MECADAAALGRLLLESHASLRDRLRVSCDALDRLVDAAMESGATGARLTGAGFGGCAVAFCPRSERDRLRRGLIERFYAGRPEFQEDLHLLDAEPSSGVLHPDQT
jgi:galactokinase